MLTRLNRKVLELMAAHELLAAGHVRIHLGEHSQATEGLLAALVAAGLAKRERFPPAHADTFRITRAGLAAIDSDLPPPQAQSHQRQHTGAVWLWLAARTGTFGDTERVLSEREMRSLDKQGLLADDPPDDPRRSAFASGRERSPFGVLTDEQRGDALHYPDVMPLTAKGRVAIELRLCSPSPRILCRTIDAYGLCPNIAGVLYLVTNPALASPLLAAAASVNRSSLVRVQHVRLG